MADRSIEIPALPELLESFAPDGVVVTAEPREIVTRLHQAARHVEGGSLRSRSDAETPKRPKRRLTGPRPSRH